MSKSRIENLNREDKTYIRQKGLINIKLTFRQDTNSEIIDGIVILEDILKEMKEDLIKINKK